MELKIDVVVDDGAIAACYNVLHELRPHITADEFVGRVRKQQQSGYRLAAGSVAGRVVAVAGYRIGENLAWGRFLYVDDLVTAASERSRGYGAQMVAWLKAQGVKEGCRQLHLDSGVQRIEAHRFYERKGMSKSSFHFMEKL